MERFRNIKIGDVVYVYEHATKLIKKAHIIGIHPSNYEMNISSNNIDGFGSFNSTSFDFTFDTNRQISCRDGYTPIKHGSFSVCYKDEKSRRGITYVGFITEEDAKEFKLEFIVREIKNKQKEIDKLEESIKKLGLQSL